MILTIDCTQKLLQLSSEFTKKELDIFEEKIDKFLERNNICSKSILKKISFTYNKHKANDRVIKILFFLKDYFYMKTDNKAEFIEFEQIIQKYFLVNNERALRIFDIIIDNIINNKTDNIDSNCQLQYAYIGIYRGLLKCINGFFSSIESRKLFFNHYLDHNLTKIFNYILGYHNERLFSLLVFVVLFFLPNSKINCEMLLEMKEKLFTEQKIESENEPNLFNQKAKDYLRISIGVIDNMHGEYSSDTFKEFLEYYKIKYKEENNKEIDGFLLFLTNLIKVCDYYPPCCAVHAKYALALFY